MQSQIFFPGVSHTPENPQKRPRCLDPDTNFRLARQRFRRSCLTKRPLAPVLECAMPKTIHRKKRKSF